MKKSLVFATTLAALLASSTAFAADEVVPLAVRSPYIALGVGLTLGLAALGSALGQGRASAAALEGISRNPGASGKIQVPLIIALAFMEALTIFSWIVASNLTGKV